MSEGGEVEKKLEEMKVEAEAEPKLVNGLTLVGRAGAFSRTRSPRPGQVRSITRNGYDGRLERAG